MKLAEWISPKGNISEITKSHELFYYCSYVVDGTFCSYYWSTACPVLSAGRCLSPNHFLKGDLSAAKFGWNQPFYPHWEILLFVLYYLLKSANLSILAVLLIQLCSYLYVTYDHTYRYVQGSLCGIRVDMLDCNIVVSSNSSHFWGVSSWCNG